MATRKPVNDAASREVCAVLEVLSERSTGTRSPPDPARRVLGAGRARGMLPARDFPSVARSADAWAARRCAREGKQGGGTPFDADHVHVQSAAAIEQAAGQPELKA